MLVILMHAKKRFFLTVIVFFNFLLIIIQFIEVKKKNYRYQVLLLREITKKQLNTMILAKVPNPELP